MDLTTTNAKLCIVLVLCSNLTLWLFLKKNIVQRNKAFLQIHKKIKIRLLLLFFHRICWMRFCREIMTGNLLSIRNLKLSLSPKLSLSTFFSSFYLSLSHKTNRVYLHKSTSQLMQSPSNTFKSVIVSWVSPVNNWESIFQKSFYLKIRHFIK
jgi:hypothetical protein